MAGRPLPVCGWLLGIAPASPANLCGRILETGKKRLCMGAGLLAINNVDGSGSKD